MKFTLSGIEPEICVSTTIRVIFAIRSDLLFGMSVSGLVDVPIIQQFSVGFKWFQRISVDLYDCTIGGL